MKAPILYTVDGGELHKVQLQRVVRAGGDQLFLQWRCGSRPRRIYVGALKPARRSSRNLAGAGRVQGGPA